MQSGGLVNDVVEQIGEEAEQEKYGRRGPAVGARGEPSHEERIDFLCGKRRGKDAARKKKGGKVPETSPG